MKRNLFVILVLLTAILCAYGGLWRTFFQQDEWVSLGFVQANGLWGNIPSNSLPELLSGKERILGSLVNNILHYMFPFNILVFSAFALSLHWINSILVYALIQRFIKNWYVSLVAALFFSVATTASQTVSWISANTTALPNAFFTLLSVYTMAIHTERKNHMFFLLSLLFAYIAFLFKESSLFLFVFLPLFYWMKFHGSPLSLMKKFSPVLAFILFAVVVRLIGLGGAEGKAGVYVTRNADSALRMGMHAVMYPLLGVSQMFMPKEVLFPLTDRMLRTSYEFLISNPLRQTIGLILIGDLLSLFVSFILLGGVLVMSRVRSLQFGFSFAVWFIFLSFLPFVVLDRPASTYLESRYYYLPTIGGAILIAYVLLWLIRKAQQIGRGFVSVIAVLAIVVVTAGYLYKNVVYIQRGVQVDRIIAQERLDFLRQLDELVPVVPDKPIFFITGDSPGYYGIPHLAVPFQQGVGYTIMVWFFHSGKIPPNFLATYFLWNINTQGYAEENGRGFGYFWDQQAFEEFRKSKPGISPSRIVKLHYLSGQKRLVHEAVY